MHIPHIKPVLIGVGGTLVTLYVISRLLPGAAARVGLMPRPFWEAQISWPEPFGLKPLSSYWKKSSERSQALSASDNSPY